MSDYEDFDDGDNEYNDDGDGYNDEGDGEFEDYGGGKEEREGDDFERGFGELDQTSLITIGEDFGTAPVENATSFIAQKEAKSDEVLFKDSLRKHLKEVLFNLDNLDEVIYTIIQRITQIPRYHNLNIAMIGSLAKYNIDPSKKEFTSDNFSGIMQKYKIPEQNYTDFIRYHKLLQPYLNL